MSVSISNIAWDPHEDEAIAALLARTGVAAIDVAPGKYFPDPAAARAADIGRVRQSWADRGIRIHGMQALLFGTSGLNVFGDAPVQEAMLRHLDAVCRIGAGLDGTRLVFGSPKNRDRGGLTDAQAHGVAVSFFRRVGDLAQAHGVVVCLEPNPSVYGCNFMTHSVETARVVESVGHPAIRMQFDTGALTINGEDPMTVLQAFAPLVGHVHASEPQLLPLGDGGTDHARMAEALRRYLPDHVVAIEMLATAGESHATAIERAIGVANRHYRNCDD